MRERQKDSPNVYNIHNIKISMHNAHSNESRGRYEEIWKYGTCVTKLVCKIEIISIVNELQSIWNSISISVWIVTACMHTHLANGRKSVTWEYEWEWKNTLWISNLIIWKRPARFLLYVCMLASNIFSMENIIAISLFSLSLSHLFVINFFSI